jgi:hypothetical protein
MSRDTTGAITQLPIAPRKVPFDVDLGYLGEGVEVAAYSRCRQEPQIVGGGSGGALPDWATGRGCDIYLFDFEQQREVKYAPTAGGRASEFLPTVSPAGRIAFARVYEHRHGMRGRLPYLYAKRGSHSLRRLRGGPRGRSGLPGPTSLDLSGRRLAFGWDWAPRHRGIAASTVRVDTVDGSHRTLDRIIGGLNVRTLFSPSIVVRDVLWGRTVVPEDRPPRSDFRYHKGSIVTLALTAAAPLVLVSTAGVPARGGIYYITSRSAPSPPVPGGAPGCGSSPPGQSPYPATCTVGRTGPVAF